MATLLTLDNLGWFDRVTPPGVKLGLAYSEDGFVVRDALGDAYGLTYKISDRSAVLPMSSGAYLSAVLPEVARADGRRFGLSAIDIDAPSNGAVYVTFLGVKADASVVQFSAVVDGTVNSYQTLSLPPGFSDLISLKFSVPGLNQISFDNLVLTTPTLIQGSPTGDTLHGTSGADEIFGYGGADTLYGDGGGDWLDGGAGDDVMIGGQGDDLYFVNSRQDLVLESADGGKDIVRSGINNLQPDHVEDLELLWGGDAHGGGNALDNRLVGNTGANVLRGFNGNDVLTGKAGDDSLDGGWGNDTLQGGAGLDLLHGGGGADLFVFQRDELGGGGPLAIIDDFHRAEGDKISVGGVFVFPFIGSNPFTGAPGYADEGASAGQFRYETFSGGVWLQGDVDGDGAADWTVQLLGVTSLQASDFVF